MTGYLSASGPYSSPNWFPTFSHLGKHICFIIIALNGSSDPPMCVPLGWCIQFRWRRPRFSPCCICTTFVSRVVLSIAIIYSFTCFAYSSNGTPNLFAIAICDGVNLTVLRPFGDTDLEAVAPAEATLGPEDFFV